MKIRVINFPLNIYERLIKANRQGEKEFFVNRRQFNDLVYKDRICFLDLIIKTSTIAGAGRKRLAVYYGPNIKTEIILKNDR